MARGVFDEDKIFRRPTSGTSLWRSIRLGFVEGFSLGIGIVVAVDIAKGLGLL